MSTKFLFSFERVATSMEEGCDIFSTGCIGGKALNLIKMVKAQRSSNDLANAIIPNGFVITTHAYRYFLRETDASNSAHKSCLEDCIREAMQQLLALGELSSSAAKQMVKDTCAQIRQAIEVAPFPLAIQTAIAEQLLETAAISTATNKEIDTGTNVDISPSINENVIDTSASIDGNVIGTSASISGNIGVDISVSTATAGVLKNQSNALRFAVRSSATSEDLADQSFAGQHQTFLNCSGQITTICNAVQKCWASLFNEGAILYRLSHRLSLNGAQQHQEMRNNLQIHSPRDDKEPNHYDNDLLVPQMAVVVQEMVPHVMCSGVMFTADITNNHHRRIIIEASFGLGETLVSGKVQPDKYTVDKRTGQLMEQIVREKTVAVVAVADTTSHSEGTLDKEITEESERWKQVLSQAQVSQLAACGMQLEHLYAGHPQDVEFTFDHNGQLYLLQTRAITSLHPIPAPIVPFYATTSQQTGLQDDKQREHVYMCFNHVQVMTDPMTYFGLSVMKIFLTHLFGFQLTTDIKERVQSSANRVYLDMSDVLSLRGIGARFAQAISAADVWLSKSLLYVKQSQDFALNAAKATWYNLISLVLKFIVFMCTVLYTVLFCSFENIKQRLEKLSTEKMAEMEDRFFNKKHTTLMNVKQATDTLYGNFISNLFLKVWFRYVASAAFVSFGWLHAITPASHTHLLPQMLKGLQLKTTEMDFAIKDLVAAVRRRDSIVARCRTLLQETTGNESSSISTGHESSSISNQETTGNESYTTSKKKTRITSQDLLDILSSDSTLVGHATTFFNDFGFRGYREIDAGRDRYEEDATLIVKLICTGLESQHESLETLEAQGEIAARGIVDAILKDTLDNSWFNWFTFGLWYLLKQALVNKLIGNVRQGFGFRETPKHFMMKSIMDVKRHVFALAQQQLSFLSREDLPFLMLEEIEYLAQQQHQYQQQQQQHVVATADHSPSCMGLQQWDALQQQVLSLISRRRVEFARFEKMNPPRVMTNSGENAELSAMKLESENDELLQQADGNENGTVSLVLRGTGISAGTVTGTVRIVLDPNTTDLLPGEILVAKNVDPGYNPLFLHAKALISEVGGMMTHGSVVCRELGIPGVVCVPMATTKLHNGQTVSLNGTTGIVKVLLENQEQ